MGSSSKMLRNTNESSNGAWQISASLIFLIKLLITYIRNTKVNILKQCLSYSWVNKLIVGDLSLKLSNKIQNILA